MGSSYLLGRAAKLEEAGRFGEALQVLDKAAAAPGAKAGVHIRRAVVLSILEKPEEAIAAATTAIEREPSNPASGIYLGMFLLDAGKISESRKVLERSLALDPGNMLAEGILAAADFMEGKPAEGASRLDSKKLIAHPEILLRLAPLVERAALDKKHGAERVKSAVSKLKSIFGKKGAAVKGAELPIAAAETSLRTGWRYFFNGSYEKAVPHLGNAAALTNALYGLSLFYADKRAEAMESLKKTAEDLEKGRVPLTEETFEAYECYGELVFDESMLAESHDIFQGLAALQESPGGGRSDYFLGVLAEFSGKRRVAAGHFRISAEREPNISVERLKTALKRLGSKNL